MSGIIGKNIGMTSLFDESGWNIPCTIIEAGPCIVLQIKTKEKDGYDSCQLGFDEKKIKNTNKPLLGFFKKNKSTPKKKIFEFSIKKKIKSGDLIKINIFNENEYVNITGISKGKGFQGVVKRHGFSGVGEKSHGQHNRSRAPGSIGAGSDPSRVFKGTKMAGRLGNKKVTLKKIKILKIDLIKNLLIVKGSVPGHKNSYLIIRK
ncbi:50S ribosomal protein L3 [Candidatus Karelsulcia muelleri]|uniref:50S ribosomal protein L3 n=1 Tax=Candidatus Karelsulcia muelleri TaxID=336810 RepID=UPI000597C3B7|nr:50S ribosomal protein L3 [Candidatus Karelsulcia muelleri]NJJ98735.1 50S ribosomal protein L3 [Candidatus Karelsulcia muelleri]